MLRRVHSRLTLLSLLCSGVLGAIGLLPVSWTSADDDRGVVISPQSPSAPAEPYNQSWAVVVGVDRFRDPRVAPLNYAANDARSVARTLAALGFAPDKTFLFLNDQATRVAIEGALSGVIRRRAKPDDRVFIFFAMHGVTEQLPHGGEEGYLLPHDTDVDNLPLTALSMQQLKQIGQRIAAKHILIAVDACYGGYTLVRAQPPSRADQRYIDLMLKSRTIQVLTAGRRDQPVIEDQGHGVFTRALLRGLEGHADGNGDGLITAAELAAWMHPRVAQASDFKQDMQWGSLDGEGQFVFFLPRPAVATREARPSPPPLQPAPRATPPPPPVGALPSSPAPTPAGVKTPEGKAPEGKAREEKAPEERVAALIPDPGLRPFTGNWEGWMSTRLTEALASMSVIQTGNALEARFVVSNARFLGAGSEGFQESYVLQQRFGVPLALSRVTASGQWFSGQNADGSLKVELTLSKDSRTMQGNIKVDGAWYSVYFRRK